MTTKRPKWLEMAAHRASERPWMLGATLEQYCRIEGMTREQLSSQLGCSSELLAWLCLCRRPASEHFARDVMRIAERFHIDAPKLAQVVRHVDTVATIREAANTGGESVLLAARDRGERTKR
jgi:hypothetical protein